MKLTSLCLVLGLLGLTASWRALQASDTSAAHGAQTTFYANGQPQLEVQYIDGRREGLSRRWYADGQLMAEGRYARGKMAGRWSWWLADGSPDAARSGLYSDDERIGD